MTAWLVLGIALALAGLAYLIFGPEQLLGGNGPDKSGALFGDVFLAKKTANGNGLGRALSDPSGPAED